MPIRRASLLMPCSRLEDLPTRLRGTEAAELLSAWTTLWHPLLIHATGSLPGWHSADEPPEPEVLQEELILVPSVSRERLPVDWKDRVQSAIPNVPVPVFSRASRAETVAAALDAASLAADGVSPAVAADFLALGYAHLQVELLTRAMRYTSVLDPVEFRTAVIGAASAAAAGDNERARDGLASAFDLLADARNHFYGVDFYLIDVTLLAESTLGESLRQRIATGPPTNLLGPASLLEKMAAKHPETLAALSSAIGTGQACLLAGPQCGPALEHRAPEAILAELLETRELQRRLLNADAAIFGQFGAGYSPLLPETLRNIGFHGALYAAFDGQRCERPAQIKSRWGETGGRAIDMLAAAPLDVAEPGTWLGLGERIGDTLMRDHVATLLLAGWPGRGSEYYDDLRRITAYGPVLGKFVTLDEYFRLTAEADNWTSFHPQSYSPRALSVDSELVLSSKIDAYRQEVFETFDRLSASLNAVLGAVESNADASDTGTVVLNPWNFAGPRYVGFDPASWDSVGADVQHKSQLLPNVPGCGYAAVARVIESPPLPLAEGRTLRNEFVEAVVGESTGGIQSIRAHRDRNTRVSQRLVMHDRRLPRRPNERASTADEPQLDVEMIAERSEITANNALFGEITSRGRLVDAHNQPLAEFSQSMRLMRGLPVVFVEVRLSPILLPEGDPWSSYFASRLAWREEAVTITHGVDWTARPTGRSRIESPECVDISDATGSITCFGLGLPLHRLAAPTWLDTLLAVAGDAPECVRFAVGVNCGQPTQMALALLTAGRSSITKLPSPPASPTGWFFHVSAKHVIVTHLKPLPAPRDGVRIRLLEVAGQAVRTSFTAFRPFRQAQRTDFRGELVETLEIADGRVQFEITPYGWLQIEAEW